MAEAVMEQRRNRFYCHQCSVEINPTLPQFTCPRCDNGFIEEITDDFSSSNDDIPAALLQGTSRAAANPMLDFGELWGNTFLQSFRQHAQAGSAAANPLIPPTTAEEEQARQDDEDMADDDDEEDDFMQQHAPHHPFAPYARIQFRSRVPRGNLQSIIGQLLSGLAGGGGMGAGVPGQPPHFFLGNMMGGAPGLHGNLGDYAWGPGGLDAIISQLMNQLEGTGPPAASKEQMDKLPTTQVTQEQVDSIMQCSVCMEDFSLNETVRQLPCNHCFHTDCIMPWLQLHGTCPVCRKTLDGHDTSCQEQSLADAVQATSATTPTSNDASAADPTQASSSASTSSSSNNPPPSSSNMDEYD